MKPLFIDTESRPLHYLRIFPKVSPTQMGGSSRLSSLCERFAEMRGGIRQYRAAILKIFSNMV